MLVMPLQSLHPVEFSSASESITKHPSMWAQRAHAHAHAKADFSNQIFDDAVVLGLTSKSRGVEIRYCAVGPDDSEENWLKYHMPVCLNTIGTTTIKAVAIDIRSGRRSAISETKLNVEDLQVPAPLILEPANGKTYRKPVSFSLALDPGLKKIESARIHYTTDGSKPTLHSPVWGKAAGTEDEEDESLLISSPGPHTIRAVAARKRRGHPGYKLSAEATVSFNLAISLCQLPDEVVTGVLKLVGKTKQFISKNKRALCGALKRSLGIQHSTVRILGTKRVDSSNNGKSAGKKKKAGKKSKTDTPDVDVDADTDSDATDIAGPADTGSSVADATSETEGEASGVAVDYCVELLHEDGTGEQLVAQMTSAEYVSTLADTMAEAGMGEASILEAELSVEKVESRVFRHCNLNLVWEFPSKLCSDGSTSEAKVTDFLDGSALLYAEGKCVKVIDYSHKEYKVEVEEDEEDEEDDDDEEKEEEVPAAGVDTTVAAMKAKNQKAQLPPLPANVTKLPAQPQPQQPLPLPPSPTQQPQDAEEADATEEQEEPIMDAEVEVLTPGQAQEAHAHAHAAPDSSGAEVEVVASDEAPLLNSKAKKGKNGKGKNGKGKGKGKEAKGKAKAKTIKSKFALPAFMSKQKKQKKQQPFAVGTQIEADWQSKGTWYAGKITAVEEVAQQQQQQQQQQEKNKQTQQQQKQQKHKGKQQKLPPLPGDRLYSIKYEDGATEEKVPASRIRLPSKNTQLAVSHSGDVMGSTSGKHVIKFDLELIPAHITDVHIALSAYNCGDLSRFPPPTIRLYDVDRPDHQLLDYRLTSAGSNQAVLMCSLRRRPIVSAQGSTSQAALALAAEGQGDQEQSQSGKKKQQRSRWSVEACGKTCKGTVRDYSPIKAAIEPLQRRHELWQRRRMMVLLRQRALGLGGALQPLAGKEADGAALALRLFELPEPLWQGVMGYV